MEELGLPYDLVRYERDASFKAPPALAAVHPLGKAPVIVDGDLVIGESAVILAYVNMRYGNRRLAPPQGTAHDFAHEDWLQYAESTAAFPIMTMRIGALTGGIPERMLAFFAPVLQRTLNRIASAVRAHEYLIGTEITLADIQMAYLLEVAERTSLLEGHPEIAAYLARLKARPAFVRAEQVGGPMMPPAPDTVMGKVP
jgi:glutathione S-transferase